MGVLVVLVVTGGLVGVLVVGGEVAAVEGVTSDLCAAVSSCGVAAAGDSWCAPVMSVFAENREM